MTNCDMCKAEADKKDYINEAKFGILYERDEKVVMQELCLLCLKRTMLIIVRDLKGKLKVVVSPLSGKE